MEKNFNLEKRTSLLLNAAQGITLALMVTIFLYPLIVSTILQQSAGSAGFTSRSPLIVLAGLGGVLLLISARALASFPLKAALKEPAGRTQAGILQGWFASVVIGQVLRSGCATVGLVIAVLTHSLNWCALLGVAAFLSIGRNWPRRADLRKALEKSAQ